MNLFFGQAEPRRPSPGIRPEPAPCRPHRLRPSGPGPRRRPPGTRGKRYPPARALLPRERVVPPAGQRQRPPHLHPQQRRRPRRPLALRPRLVRLHHSRYHRCRCPRHRPLQRRQGPPPRHTSPHRLHRRRPRPGSRLLPPPPHPGSGSPSGKSLHGQPFRLCLPPQPRRLASHR